MSQSDLAWLGKDSARFIPRLLLLINPEPENKAKPLQLVLCWFHHVCYNHYCLVPSALLASFQVSCWGKSLSSSTFKNTHTNNIKKFREPSQFTLLSTTLGSSGGCALCRCIFLLRVLPLKRPSGISLVPRPFSLLRKEGLINFLGLVHPHPCTILAAVTFPLPSCSICEAHLKS